jgi:hypothetical protein
MKIKIIVLFILWFLFGSVKLYSQNKVDFDTTNWLLGDNTTITEFAGRKSLAGTAYLKNIELLNGTIEVDLYTTEERNFGGFIFRVQSFNEYEWCWLRMHKTNGFIEDGIQYAPVFNGEACWQLYGGKGCIGKVNVPKNQWVHMKIEILNTSAKLFVGDMNTPVLVMDHLHGDFKKGLIGLRSNFKGSVYFSNFTYTIDNNETVENSRESVPPNILAKWQLSPQFKIRDFSDMESYPGNRLAEIKKWIIPDVEVLGLINISKYLTHTGDDPDCAILRTNFIADKDTTIIMHFGYSDAVNIFLNQRPLFWGNSTYRIRNEAFGGWISYDDAIYLNLKKGKNELLVLVAEVFGGWGFQAKLQEMKNITTVIE